MKSKGIIKNAITSNLLRELACCAPIVSDQRRTYVAESLASQPPYRPELRASKCQRTGLSSLIP